MQFIMKWQLLHPTFSSDGKATFISTFELLKKYKEKVTRLYGKTSYPIAELRKCIRLQELERQYCRGKREGWCTAMKEATFEMSDGFLVHAFD